MLDFLENFVHVLKGPKLITKKKMTKNNEKRKPRKPARLLVSL